MTRLFCAALMLLVAESGAAGHQVELKQGFDAGQLALTFTGKEGGAKMELKIKNQTEAPLVVIIKSGVTTFELPDQKVSLSTTSERKLNLAASGEGTIVLDQGGSSRIVKGSMTVSKVPPKK